MVDYTMTAFGLTLAQALMPLCIWGTEHRAASQRSFLRTRLNNMPEPVELASDLANLECTTTPSKRTMDRIVSHLIESEP
jgi:hypothetical protein